MSLLRLGFDPGAGAAGGHFPMPLERKKKQLRHELKSLGSCLLWESETILTPPTGGPYTWVGWMLFNGRHLELCIRIWLSRNLRG